uniref:V-set and transmembrane domain containing 1 n=1 Tax=Piliocolobus tephrosceles TaxID=591936 RepID=A0A8C9JCB8_9PRIM
LLPPFTRASLNFFTLTFRALGRNHIASTPAAGLREEFVITLKFSTIDTRTIFVTIFSCISILLLFLSVFIIYRCSQHGSSPEESTKRISHSKLSEQEAAEADLSRMERVSVSTPQGVTYAELNINALSEAASDTTHEPPGSHEYAAVKV